MHNRSQNVQLCKMGNFKSTRHQILNVAREVFANLSVYKTTMDDIAKASKLGRRTLYTYFRSKDDLYAAVVADEIDNLMEGLRKLVNDKHSPEIKLKHYFRQRYYYMQDLLKRNPSVKYDYIKNSERVEKIRKELDKEELLLVNRILMDGNQKGCFKVKDTERVSHLMLITLKGLELQFIKKDFDASCTDTVETLYYTIFNGIKTPKNI